MERQLRQREVESLPADEVRYRLEALSADRARLSWNNAELEVQTAPNDVTRLMELLRR
ncbi:MAG: hypothetical protein AB1938_12315 [Myxococcota bacterium]